MNLLIEFSFSLFYSEDYMLKWCLIVDWIIPFPYEAEPTTLSELVLFNSCLFDCGLDNSISI